jgi:pre-mRNA-splicing factor 18
MDLLKREMERKKKALQEAKRKILMEQATSAATSGSHSQRRYMKTSDLRRLMEETNEENRIEAMRQGSDDVHLNKKRDGDAIGSSSPMIKIADDPMGMKDEWLDSKRRKVNHNGQQEKVESSTGDEAHHHQQQQYSIAMVVRELRSLGLPVTLFGENLLDRIQRVNEAKSRKAVVQLQESEADEFRLGQGHSIRNPFLEKDDAITSNDAAATAAVDAELVSHSNKESNDKRAKGVDRKLNEGDMDGPPDPHKRIYRHFKGLLKQWEADLNERPDDVKRCLAGRNETKKLKQCKDYIRPLFQLCKRRQLEENLLNKLDQMVHYCEQGEFVRAHDAYMDVAIGRAAWPIGVTMVGIHARTGRAKIESANVAHVMNSELQRKYLTSVKRLLTFEQNKRTDVDPSKKVR